MHSFAGGPGLLGRPIPGSLDWFRSFNPYFGGNWTISGSKNQWVNGMSFGSKSAAQLLQFTNSSDSILLQISREDTVPVFRYGNVGSFRRFAFVGSSPAGFIENQYGLTLSAQTAKFWVSDSIKTSGVIQSLKQLVADTLKSSTHYGYVGTRLYNYVNPKGFFLIGSDTSYTSPTGGSGFDITMAGRSDYYNGIVNIETLNTATSINLDSTIIGIRHHDTFMENDSLGTTNRVATATDSWLSGPTPRARGGNIGWWTRRDASHDPSNSEYLAAYIDRFQKFHMLYHASIGGSLTIGGGIGVTGTAEVGSLTVTTYGTIPTLYSTNAQFNGNLNVSSSSGSIHASFGGGGSVDNNATTFQAADLNYAWKLLKGNGALATGMYWTGSTVKLNTSNIEIDKDLIVNQAATITGNVTAASLIKSGGTSSQFLMADGSVSTGTAGVTLASGQYTPTITNNAGTTSLTAYLAQYMRVGNTVTVSGAVAFTTTGTGTVSFTLTLPINSNLSSSGATTGIAGTASVDATTAGTGWVQGNGVANTAYVYYNEPSTGGRSMRYTYTYTIIP